MIVQIEMSFLLKMALNELLPQYNLYSYTLTKLFFKMFFTKTVLLLFSILGAFGN